MEKSAVILMSLPLYVICFFSLGDVELSDNLHSSVYSALSIEEDKMPNISS
jgi:hypothetical protein